MHPNGKVVVVTGAGGSIGSEICTQLLRAGVRELRLLSLTENGLYEITKRLNKINEKGAVIKGYLGSVCDWTLCQKVVKGADIVIHAAAHKHVPICEQNPLAAIANNVMGTSIIAHAAKFEKVSEFILISTDKAVQPTSVMGATKRVAELILRDLLQLRFQGHPISFDNDIIFRIVRFGNVIDSAGSVIPLWKEQIKNGGPLTITDKGCERFFMSIPDAAGLVLGVLELERALGPFVFEMGKPLNMGVLAYELMETFGYVDVKITGLRPGEKLTEELTYDGSVHATANPKIKYVEEKESRRLRPQDLIALFDAVRSNNEPEALRMLWEFVK